MSEATGLGHGVQGGVRGACPSQFRTQRLEITHYVTILVMFFVVFHAFHHLFTAPKTPSFPTGPASLFGGCRGFLHIIMMFTVHIKVLCSIVVRLNTKQ